MEKSEGVIKYQLEHVVRPLPAGLDVSDLVRCHRLLHDHGLLGRDPNRYGGLAYGNISRRLRHDTFVISGTQTSDIESPDRSSYCVIEHADSATNLVRSFGPVRPSSESLSHAAIYRAGPDVGAVVHGHHPGIWRNAGTLALPVTSPEIDYGTPAMAEAIAALVLANPRGQGVIVMGGHTDGVMAYGPDLDYASRMMLDLAERVSSS